MAGADAFPSSGLAAGAAAPPVDPPPAPQPGGGSVLAKSSFLYPAGSLLVGAHPIRSIVATIAIAIDVRVFFMFCID